MTLEIGDRVRLVKGWTRMIVIGFHHDGRLIAKYENKSSDFYALCENDFKNPLHASSTQIRHPSGFVPWDGSHTPNKWKNRTMRFKTTQTYNLTHVAFTGTKRGIAQNGDIILESELGGIRVFDPTNLEPDIPFTFEVKAVGSNYRCHYTMPPKTSDVHVNDTLVSNSGNIYVVTAVGTKQPYPKGVFKGHRLVQQGL